MHLQNPNETFDINKFYKVSLYTSPLIYWQPVNQFFRKQSNAFLN